MDRLWKLDAVKKKEEGRGRKETRKSNPIGIRKSKII
jgi:hypothetical protein